MPHAHVPTSSLALCALAGSALAQPSFQGLGTLGVQASQKVISSANKVSADGTVVVGYSSSAGGQQAFRWTQGTGMVGLGFGPDALPGSQAYSCSSDGSVIVGEMMTGQGRRAFRWTPALGLVNLGDLPGSPNNSAAYACSADGSVVAGMANSNDSFPPASRTFRWTANTGMIDPGTLPGGPAATVAYAMSGDGSVFAGISGTTLDKYEACVWVNNAAPFSLGYLPGGDFYSVAVATSSDGAVIVGCTGVGGEIDYPYEAFRWTQGTGMVALGDLPGLDHYSSAAACSADGSIVVGVANWNGMPDDTVWETDAFIWDQAHGMRKLQDVLEAEHHLNFRGWRLSSANSISADGRVIVGYGINPLGEVEAWIARLGCDAPACPADYNGDGFVTGEDFDSFVQDFILGC